MIDTAVFILIGLAIGPLLGGLVSGLDRILTARFQSRIGPPLWQPFYDVIKLWNQMPDPKVVVAVGSCALSGGIFREVYNVLGGVDKVIPVDVYVPGCPAKPEAIIDGVALGLQKFNQKRGEEKSDAGRCDLRQF